MNESDGMRHFQVDSKSKMCRYFHPSFIFIEARAIFFISISLHFQKKGKNSELQVVRQERKKKT